MYYRAIYGIPTEKYNFVFIQLDLNKKNIEKSIWMLKKVCLK